MINRDTPLFSLRYSPGSQNPVVVWMVIKEYFKKK